MKFEYLEPATLAEASAQLAKYGEKAKIMAGGTDLIVQMRRGTAKPEYVINIARLGGLDYIDYDERKGLKIGALTTIRSLKKSGEIRERYPVISEAAGQLASEGVRSTATLGGNLCNASPSSDMAPCLIALSAIARLAGQRKEKQVPLESFFTGAGATVLGKGELLVGVLVPPLSARTGAAYFKHGIRGSIDLSIVSVAALVTLEKDADVVHDARVVLGAVGATPLRCQKAEALLNGRAVNQTHIAEAASAAASDCRPIDDVRASAEYRREMINVFARQAIGEALKRAGSA